MAKGIRLMAIVMLALILSLPFYSANAMASLTIISVKGGDGLEGFVKPTDSLNIQVEAKYNDGSPVQVGSLVRYGGNPIGAPGTGTIDMANKGIAFDRCIHDGTCELKIDPFTAGNNPHTVPINLYDKIGVGGNWTATASYNVYVDEANPQIIISIDKTKIGLGSFNVSYIVSDTACGSCGVNKCSGLSNIEFNSSHYGLIRDVSFNTNPDDCSRSGEVQFSAAQVSSVAIGSYGTVNLRANVYDNVGHSAISNVIDLDIDMKDPIIYVDDMIVLDQSGNIPTFIPSSMIKVDISVVIEEHDLNLSSVKMDLMPINPLLRNVSGNCIHTIADNYTCSWNDVQLDIDNDVFANLVVYASDNIGNSMWDIGQFNFNVDTSVPHVRDIMTTHRVGGADYLGINDKIQVILDSPSGIGFSRKNISMDLSQVRSTMNDVLPNSCYQESYWYCNYSVNPDRPDGAYIVKVLEKSTDDFGKKIDPDVSLLMEKQVIIDRTKPVITKVDYHPQNPTAQTGLFLTALV
ncbi:MAG: hypothetical protein ABIJ08_03015, partial [Nanoarchaeota archaeon]